MKKRNVVFIAKSIDGYIADKAGGIDWLNAQPNPDNIDMGYGAFIQGIDAIVMGKNTFEMVCSFDIDWPYAVPVFVLSATLTQVPQAYQGKVTLLKGSLKQVLETIYNKGFFQLYIDGGKCIQSFFNEDLIDEMILTTMPILLGGGAPLFGTLDCSLQFEHVKSHVFLNAVVQDTYLRKR